MQKASSPLTLGFLQVAVENIEQKAKEINDSDAVKNFKSRAVEVTNPYIERGSQLYSETREKAEPVIRSAWQKTVEFGTTSYEVAKPKIEQAYEAARPTIEQVLHESTSAALNE